MIETLGDHAFSQMMNVMANIEYDATHYVRELDLRYSSLAHGTVHSYSIGNWTSWHSIRFFLGR